MAIRLSIISPFSGKTNEREIPISNEKWIEWYYLILSNKAPHIQEFFPELSADDREFILTGITPEEWDAAFSEQEDDV